MTIEITGAAASNDDNANLSVARESRQCFGEHVAHLSIEIDALWAAQCNDRNSVGHFCRQNIGVHRVLLTCNALFFLMSLLHGHFSIKTIRRCDPGAKLLVFSSANVSCHNFQRIHTTPELLQSRSTLAKNTA